MRALHTCSAPGRTGHRCVIPSTSGPTAPAVHPTTALTGPPSCTPRTLVFTLAGSQLGLSSRISRSAPGSTSPSSTNTPSWSTPGTPRLPPPPPPRSVSQQSGQRPGGTAIPGSERPDPRPMCRGLPRGRRPRGGAARRWEAMSHRPASRRPPPAPAPARIVRSAGPAPAPHRGALRTRCSPPPGIAASGHPRPAHLRAASRSPSAAPTSRGDLGSSALCGWALGSGLKWGGMEASAGLRQ